jgi:surfeit locus 1 family protein
VSTVLMLALLLGLGTWQIQRLHWKEAILARIAEAGRAPATPLPPHPAPFTKVSVAGTLDNAHAVLLGAEVHDTRQGTALGAQIIVPLLRPDGAPPVLVDRGWVPTEPPLPYGKPAGPVRIDGFIRLRERPGVFTPGNDPAGRRFFSIDPAAMGRALGLAHVASFVLVAMGPARPDVYPAPAQRLPQPPNNHLEYALTWYGLALVLLVTFIRWVAKNRRPPSAIEPSHAAQHRI